MRHVNCFKNTTKHFPSTLWCNSREAVVVVAYLKQPDAGCCEACICSDGVCKQWRCCCGVGRLVWRYGWWWWRCCMWVLWCRCCVWVRWWWRRVAPDSFLSALSRSTPFSSRSLKVTSISSSRLWIDCRHTDRGKVSVQNFVSTYLFPSYFNASFALRPNASRFNTIEDARFVVANHKNVRGKGHRREARCSRRWPARRVCM